MASNVQSRSLIQRLATPLFSPSTASSRSILPFIPRPLRYVLFILLLINFRALPFIWHLRVFRTIVSIRTRGLFKWFNHTKRRAFLKELSPIGQNPFDLTVTYKTNVSPDDMDYNAHLSNSAYAKNLDYARMRAAVIFFPTILEAKGWLGLGSAHFHYVKEIPLFADYEIRINVAGWGEKWLYLVAQFVTYPKQSKKKSEEEERKSIAALRAASAELKNSIESETAKTINAQLGPGVIPPETAPSTPWDEANLRFSSSPSAGGDAPLTPTEEEVEEVDGSSGSRSRSSSSSSVSSSASFTSAVSSSTTVPSSPDLSSTSKSQPLPSITPSTQVEDKIDFSDAMPALPPGATLHCIHVSSYCFKQGRITIPPRVALVASGFGSPDEAARRWARVSEIRKRKGGLRSILRGGWREFEDEGLWALDEFEEQRAKGLEAFDLLRTRMDGLKQ